MVITLVLHTKGPQFDPGQQHFGDFFLLSLINIKRLKGPGNICYLRLCQSVLLAKKKEKETGLTGFLKMIEVVLNDRLGKKVRVKCNEDDTIGDLKKLVAAQTGTRADKIRIQKWYNIYKDHITLKDYEIHDGMGLELYYN